MDTIVETGASPQIEDGHIKIANEIGEAFSKIRISGNEWRVLWVILRKTYGWHKKMDFISITQFQKETGLKRWHVSRALSNLIERQIVTKNGDSHIVSYGLQKDYTRWRAVTKNGDKPKIVTKKVSKSSPKMVNTKATTKANNSRSKKETDPRVKEFFNYWEETFQKETGQAYVFTFGKEGKLVKDLLQVHDSSTLQDGVKQFFRNEEARHRGFDIGTFKSMFNRIVAIKAVDPLEEARREARDKQVRS